MVRRVSRTGSRAKPRRRRIAFRLVLLAALAAGSLLVLHLLAARSLLSTNRLRALLNTHPESTWIDYDEAVSLWPGRFRVRNLRIRGRDQNVEWFIRLQEVRASYSLGDLLARKFHVLRARGSGLSFRLRKLRKPGDPSPAPVALIPPIPGFSDPPLASSAPRPSGAPEGRPWAVHVENLSVASFDEIWVEVYHSRGPARLTGGFFLLPGLEASIGPATVQFLSGDVRIGEEPLLSSRTGRLECRIETYDPRRVQGDAVWQKISATVSLDGRIEAMRFLNYFLRSSPEPRLAGGAGKLRLEGRIERGIARGALRLETRRLEAHTGSAALRGDVAAALEIARWNLERGPLDFSGSRVEISSVTSLAEGSRDWWGRFDLPSASLHHGVAARVEANCRDARPLFSLLGTGLPTWTRNLLEMEGLALSFDVARNGSSLRVRRLDAKGGAFHIEGEYRKTPGAKKGIFLIDAGKVNVGVAITGGGMTTLHLIGARRWFGKARDAEFRDEGDPAQRARSTTTAVP